MALTAHPGAWSQARLARTSGVLVRKLRTAAGRCPGRSRVTTPTLRSVLGTSRPAPI